MVSTIGGYYNMFSRGGSYHSPPAQPHYFQPYYPHPHTHQPQQATGGGMGPAQFPGAADFQSAAAAGYHGAAHGFSNEGHWAQNMYCPGRPYDDWGHSPFTYHPHNQTPPSSNPSPNPHSPHHYAPHPTPASPFKHEFSACSNPQQEGASQELGQVVAPHSPDSGMAISDGVSSSGSPATGQGQYQSNCMGGPSSSTSSGSEMGAMIGQHSSSLVQSRPTQARSPFEWMKKQPNYNSVATSSNNGKTRTKDKYRVVYTDTQRLELEKEFHFSRYITIRRKSELAVALGLSERQVKIWFQNRRAKERKIHRKRDEMLGRDKMASMVHISSMAPAPMCSQPNIPLQLI